MAEKFRKLTVTRLRFKGDAPNLSVAHTIKRADKKHKKKSKKSKRGKKAKKNAKRKLDTVHGDSQAGKTSNFVPVQKNGRGRIITSGLIDNIVCFSLSSHNFC